MVKVVWCVSKSSVEELVREKGWENYFARASVRYVPSLNNFVITKQRSIRWSKAWKTHTKFWPEIKETFLRNVSRERIIRKQTLKETWRCRVASTGSTKCKTNGLSTLELHFSKYLLNKRVSHPLWKHWCWDALYNARLVVLAALLLGIQVLWECYADVSKYRNASQSSRPKGSGAAWPCKPPTKNELWLTVTCH